MANSVAGRLEELENFWDALRGELGVRDEEAPATMRRMLGDEELLATQVCHRLGGPNSRDPRGNPGRFEAGGNVYKFTIQN